MGKLFFRRCPLRALRYLGFAAGDQLVAVVLEKSVHEGCSNQRCAAATRVGQDEAGWAAI
jgi:hypothetical protein